MKHDCPTCNCDNPIERMLARTGWDAKDLAMFLDVSQQHLSRWRNGRLKIPKTVQVLADIFDGRKLPEPNYTLVED